MIYTTVNSEFKNIELYFIATRVEILLKENNLYYDLKSSLDVNIKIGKN
jgi:hypothetical protein